jgi:hypothetical protein
MGTENGEPVQNSALFYVFLFMYMSLEVVIVNSSQFLQQFAVPYYHGC